MKYCTLVLVVIMAAAVWAATPDEADYAIEYKVTYTGSVDSGANNCTMNLRAQANANVLFTVVRFGHGPCRFSDRGTILHGRREMDEIWLLRRDEKGHPEVERWRIFGTGTSRVTQAPINCWECGD